MYRKTCKSEERESDRNLIKFGNKSHCDGELSIKP